MKTNTYSRCSVMVSTVRKSHAMVPLAWAVRELSPGRSGSARGRIDARGSEDLLPGGSSDPMAESDQLPLDAPVTQPGLSLAMRKMSDLVDAAVGRRPGRRRSR